MEKKDSDFSPKQETIEKYKLTLSEISLYKKLKKNKISEGLNDFHLISLISSKKTYKKCINLIPKFKEIIKKFNFGNIKISKKLLNQLKNGAGYFLNNCKDNNGFGIVICEWSKWFPEGSKKDWRKETIVLCLFIIQEILKHDIKNLREGFIFLVDLKGFKWKNFDFKVEVDFQKVLKCIPVRLKKEIIVNMPWFFNVIYKMLKPFTTKKFRERFFIIKDYKKLNKLINKDNLPKKFEGNINFNLEEWVLTNFINLIEDEEEKSILLEKKEKKETFEVCENIIEEIISVIETSKHLIDKTVSKLV